MANVLWGEVICLDVTVNNEHMTFDAHDEDSQVLHVRIATDEERTDGIDYVVIGRVS